MMESIFPLALNRTLSLFIGNHPCFKGKMVTEFMNNLLAEGGKLFG